MPPQTQYLPIAGISQTDLWISKTDDERTAREARMSASSHKSKITKMSKFINYYEYYHCEKSYDVSLEEYDNFNFWHMLNIWYTLAWRNMIRVTSLIQGVKT